MTANELIKALRRLKVQTGSLACLGCGYEHNCGIHGCAILREAIARVASFKRRLTKMLLWNLLQNIWALSLFACVSWRRQRRQMRGDDDAQ